MSAPIRLLFSRRPRRHPVTPLNQSDLDPMLDLLNRAEDLIFTGLGRTIEDTSPPLYASQREALANHLLALAP
jgi:hypothetical protein